MADDTTTPGDPRTPAVVTKDAETASYTEKYETDENGLPDPDSVILDDDDAVDFIQEFLAEAYGEQYRYAKLQFILKANKAHLTDFEGK